MNYNNILFCGISDKNLTSERVQLISSKLHSKNIFGVYTAKKPINGKYNQLINFWNIINDMYSEYESEYKYSLDDDLLRFMSKYDMEIMYMYKRAPKKYRLFETAKNSYYNHLRFWNNFLKTNKINAVVFSQVPHEIYDYIVYRLCNYYHIKTCMSDVMSVYDTKNNRKMFFKSLEYDDDDLVKMFNNYKNKYKNVKDDDIILDATYEDYLRIYNSLNNINTDEKTVFSVTSSNNEVKRYSGKNEVTLIDIIHNPILQIPKYLWKQFKYLLLSFETKSLFNYYDKKAIPFDKSENTKYVFVPLHYTPECTSCPQGGGIFCDQAIFIEILSSSLPNDVFLYVKEHPTQTAYAREKNFYDRLLNLKNVRLIKMKEHSYDLIHNSIGVSSLTGTSGYECQFLNKPFIMFGYYVSRFLPGTIHVRSVEDCKKAVEKILNNKIKWELKDIKVYLKFIEDNSIVVDDVSDEVYADEVLRVLCK